MTRQLEILDLRKLKITFVSDSKVVFTYDKGKYMFKLDDSKKKLYSLYEIVIDSTGKSTAKFMCNGVNDITALDTIRYTETDGIEKEYFVKKLVQAGVTTGMFESEYHTLMMGKALIEADLKRLENDLIECDKEFFRSHVLRKSSTVTK